MATIAFLGLGNMGAPMARNLAKAGHLVRGFDVAAEARSDFAKDGTVVDSIALAVSGADVVITMLPAGEHVRTAYAEIVPNAPSGAVFIDCSTIDVATARAVSAEAGAAGFSMCDAPVSGGVAGAEGATLTFMVGGADTAFAKVEPILATMGKTIVHAGG
ncbi:MAG: NAD(P)-binding domain-containing protein, partial [Pseudomonadota bacterium]